MACRCQLLVYYKGSNRHPPKGRHSARKGTDHRVIYIRCLWHGRTPSLWPPVCPNVSAAAWGRLAQRFRSGVGLSAGPWVTAWSALSHQGGHSDQGSLCHTGVLSQQEALCHTGVLSQREALCHTGVLSQHGPLCHTGVLSRHGPLCHTGVLSQQGPLCHTGVLSQQGPLCHTRIVTVIEGHYLTPG